MAVALETGLELESKIPLFCSQQYVNTSLLASVVAGAISLKAVPFGMVKFGTIGIIGAALLLETPTTQFPEPVICATISAILTA